MVELYRMKKLYSMSFFDGTLNRKEAVNIIRNRDKDVSLIYTRGLEYRNPSICREPISTDEAIEIVENESLVDVTFYEGLIYVHSYSSNDMW